MDEINIEDFMKVDLRVAKIIKAESVEEADKLLKLELDVGEFGNKTVFAGMKKIYDADSLINKLVICVIVSTVMLGTLFIVGFFIGFHQ